MHDIVVEANLHDSAPIFEITLGKRSGTVEGNWIYNYIRN